MFSPKVRTLSKLSILLFARAATAQLSHTVDQVFPSAGSEAVSLIIGDVSLSNSIFEHGCWCGKLGSPQNSFLLGGANTLDELDDICKQWFLARHCNTKDDEGSCYNVDTDGFSYQLIVHEGPNPEVHAECDNVGNQCELDSCSIDLHFACKIDEFLKNNPGFQSTPVTDADQCPHRPGNGVGSRVCEFPAIPVPAEPATPETPAQKCEGNVADMIFIMDGSGSVSASSYSLGVEFIRDLTEDLDVGSDKTRVSLNQYSLQTKFYTVYAESQSHIGQALDVMADDQMEMNTMTNYALYGATQAMTIYGRPNAAHVVVILTDGRSSHGLYLSMGGQSIFAPQLLHDLGATVFAIGIGQGVDQSELEDIATSPNHLYNVADYGALSNVKAEILLAACEAQASPVSGSARNMKMMNKTPPTDGIVFDFSTPEDRKRENQDPADYQN